MTAFNASRAVELGHELRALRMRAGLTQRQVAEQLGRADSHVSRWEKGKLLPSEADTASMLLLYHVTGEERDRLLAMAREAADPNWVVPGTGRRLAALIATENAAERIVNVEPEVIPGLLQTPEYARIVIANADVPHDQLDQRVEERLRRQNVLRKDDAPEYIAVIGEKALTYPPCDMTVMIDQFRKLLTLSELPNVSIHVLRLSVSDTPALFGAFLLMVPRRRGDRRSDPVVRQEHYRAATTLSSRRDVRDYQAAVDVILRKAMNASGSVTFIAKLLEEMERGRT